MADDFERPIDQLIRSGAFSRVLSGKSMSLFGHVIEMFREDDARDLPHHFGLVLT
jgi:hypothetical protein